MGRIANEHEEIRMTATAPWEQARRRATQLRHFYIHVLVFLVGNATAFLLNLMTLGDGRHSWWFQWGLLVWSTALGAHGLTVVGGTRWLGPEWEQRQIDRYLAGAGTSMPASSEVPTHSGR
jgi:hypothetical protein